MDYLSASSIDEYQLRLTFIDELRSPSSPEIAISEVQSKSARHLAQDSPHRHQLIIVCRTYILDVPDAVIGSIVRPFFSISR
jgi:hypothetical protein